MRKMLSSEALAIAICALFAICHGAPTIDRDFSPDETNKKLLNVRDRTSRLLIKRNVAESKGESLLESWNSDSSPMVSEMKTLLPDDRYIPNRLTRKDAFKSRGWGAGGMPFSVLYMSPHGPRIAQPSSTTAASIHQHDKEMPFETPSVTQEHLGYRIALRNSASSQQRRQYSIIPQLFISYGWGPFGK